MLVILFSKSGKCPPAGAPESNVNSSVILRAVDNVLRQPGTNRENFAVLLTDAARYMSLAGKTLKELYPTLMHVTCIAQHLLHNCSM